jgi:hypothetical protein
MRRTRLIFKYSLRHCRRAEEQARADAMAKSLTLEHNSFWKGVRSHTSSNMSNSTSIDNVSGDDNILNYGRIMM